MLQVNLSGIESFIENSTIDYYATAQAHRTLSERSGEGSELTGWINLPEQMLADGNLKRICSLAERIREQSSVLVVIGIGGSYLGARAGLELIRSANYNLLEKSAPNIYFAGNSLSPAEISELIEIIGDRDFSVNVISKSGDTLETCLAFRAFKSLMEKKYGAAQAKKRIYVTTGTSGALRTMADSDGYETVSYSEGLGGRYSVLSPVGLLPLACAGVDIEKILNVATAAMQQFSKQTPLNPAWQYAAARQQLYRMNRTVEMLSCFEPAFHYMGEWWKQLFAESEGKNGVGILPVTLEYSADLHSMGQYLQDGPRNMIETIVSFRRPKRDLQIPFDIGDRDSLNFLAGKSFDKVNKTVEQAVKSAHIAGGVPSIGITCDAMDETGFAELVCFFEVSCAISGYVLGINPFDQPGVEAYKQNMKRMLENIE